MLSKIGNLNSLPRTLLMTAEFDPLPDEGDSYAKRLLKAGVPVRMTRYDSMTHTWTDFPHLRQSAEAMGEAAAELRKASKANTPFNSTLNIAKRVDCT